MNEATPSLHPLTSSADQMEIAKQDLELAIRWQRPYVLMITYGSEYVRADAVGMLENHLLDWDQKIVWIHAGDSVVSSLNFWHTILQDADQVVFFLDGFDELSYQPGFMAILQHHTNIFIENNVRLVFWMKYKEASTLAYQAPALWTIRQHLIELAASPKPEQILQSALESAWQGTGEYSDQFEDTEAKISLRESFLTDLPKSNESTSIRANLLLALGILHWRRGDYEKSNEMLQSAIKFAGQMQDNWFEAECFNALALMKSSFGKNEDAIDAYKQAIQLAPEQIFAWNNLGNLCLRINRTHEAMIAFQKALKHNKSDAIAWNGLGDVYSHSDYVDDAISAYRKSIELAPNLPHPWLGLGEIYGRSGRPNEAVLAYQKAIKLNNKFMLPWLGLAKLYAKQDRYREAIKAYEQVLMMEPQNSIIWNELGCVHLKAGRYEEAIETIAKAIELDRGFGWAYSNLALAHARSEKVEESIPLYLKGLDLLHDQEQRNITWNRLADGYRMLNDYEKAIKAYQMADSHHLGNSQGIALHSDLPVPASAPETDPFPETESTQPEERNVEDPVEELMDPVEQNPEEEMPYWVIQSSDSYEDSAAPLLQTSSYLFGTEITNKAVQPVTNTQEIGGLSMQMTIPFIKDRQVFTSAVVPKKLSTSAPEPRVDASNARMWNEKGNLLFRAGAVDDAISAYNKAIKYDREFGWPYCNLGIAYLHLQKFAEAILLLQKSLEFLSTTREQAVAWNELGNLYRGLNDYNNAVAAYRKADELDPEYSCVRDTVEYLHAEPNAGNAQVWNQLGDSFFKACAYQEASDCYQMAADLEPTNGWSFRSLALSLTFQSKFEEAVPLFLKSIELFKDDKAKAEAWNRLGNVYRRLNDYDNAIAAYQNAVKLNHENGTLLTRTRFSLLGNCYRD